MSHTKIIFLILPKLHLLDFAGPLQVFHEALEGGADISLEYCSPGETSTSAHFPLGKLKHFRDMHIQTGDYLIIPGCEVQYLVSQKMAEEKELINWVKAAYENGVVVCSICTGAFFLAMTGLLNGRKCTTHWKRTEELKTRYPAIDLQKDILFTEDTRIYTSAGVASGIDLALYIVSKLKDDSFSYKVARELVVYMRRQGAQSQQSIFMSYRNHIHSGIHKVQDFLQENIDKKVSLIQLSDIACMSSRSLTRTFKKETRITVNEYVTLIRKERLTELSKNPDISRKQMARHCGLKSERQVIRLLKTV